MSLSTLRTASDILSSTAGHDKLLRTATYALKLLAARSGVVNRLTGTLTTLRWLLLNPYSGVDPVMELLFRAQMLSMMVYYPAEAASWLSARLPRVVSLDAGRMSVLSCRAWLLYIVLEMAAALYSARRARARVAEVSGRTTYMAMKRREDGDGPQRYVEADRQARLSAALAKLKDSQLSFAQQLCDLPLALHWSRSPSSLLSPTAVAVLGLAGALVGGYRKWLAAAK